MAFLLNVRATKNPYDYFFKTDEVFLVFMKKHTQGFTLPFNDPQKMKD